DREGIRARRQLFYRVRSGSVGYVSRGEICRCVGNSDFSASDGSAARVGDGTGELSILDLGYCGNGQQETTTTHEETRLQLLHWILRERRSEFNQISRKANHE